MNWYDKACEQLDEALNNGEITQKEYREQMRDLREELRAGAEEAAEQARDNYYSSW